MKPSHKTRLLLAAASAAVVAAFVGFAHAQDDTATAYGDLVECEALLPAEKRYTMSIRLDVDTRAGQESTLSATMLDDADPGSVEVPEGTGPYVRCILGLLGVPDADL